MSVWLHLLSQQAELKGSAPGEQKQDVSCSGVGGPLGVVSRLTLVMMTSLLGLIYTSQSLAGNPQEIWKKMLLGGEMGIG